jgi:hypothetical protein
MLSTHYSYSQCYCNPFLMSLIHSSIDPVFTEDTLSVRQCTGSWDCSLYTCGMSLQSGKKEDKLGCG